MFDSLDDLEYMTIIKDYLTKEVILLKEIPHHDSNRLNHSLKVSHLSYKMAKKLRLNYQSVAKAGLLHDLYFNRIKDLNFMKDKVKLFMNEHPYDAVVNAKKIFNLTPMEENIILSHMWPVSKYFPKYKESLIVGLADKFISFKEFFDKERYKLSYNIGVYFLLFTYLFIER